MSRRKTERLLNLVICLLAARRYLSKDEIRRAVPGYAASDEAFERAFERDKEDLREMGVPVATGTNDPLFDDEPGYRIPRDAYALPDVSFAPDEMAVLALAARAWQQASLAGAASSALLKLQAYGVETDEIAIAGIDPRVDTDEAAFLPLWQAVRDRRPVRFDYRRPGRDVQSRDVEPWGIVSWHGRWYLVGNDLDRGADRVFRVSRITGDVVAYGPAGSVVVPPGVDVRGAASRAASAGAPTGTATLRVRPGAAGFLRRQATRSSTSTDGTAGMAGTAGADGTAGTAGWDVLSVPMSDPGLLADALVGLGAAVVVLDPPVLREAVLRRLTAVLDGAPAGSAA